MSQREPYKILLPRLPRVYPGLPRWGGVSHCWSTRAWSGAREGDVSPQLQEGRTPLYVAKELQQRGGMGQHCKPNCAIIHFTITVNFELYIPKYYPFFSQSWKSRSSKLRAQKYDRLHMRFAHAQWYIITKYKIVRLSPGEHLQRIHCIYFTATMDHHLTLARIFLGVMLCCATHGLSANRRRWFYPAFQQRNPVGADCLLLEDHPCNDVFNRTGYERYAKFPNSRGMTMEGARSEFMQYYTLFSLKLEGCYLEMWSLLCFHYFPQCRPGLSTSFIVTPCRETCERARAGCDDFLRERNLTWPEHLDCPKFNSSHRDPLCVNRSAVERPSLTLTPDPTPTSVTWTSTPDPTTGTSPSPPTTTTAMSPSTTTSIPNNTPELQTRKLQYFGYVRINHTETYLQCKQRFYCVSLQHRVTQDANIV